MGRTKQRSVKPYLGRKKRRCFEKQKEDILKLRPVEEETSPVSASARKMDYFGVNEEYIVGQREKDNFLTEGHDFFAFFQFSCLSGLVKKLLCPFCMSTEVRVTLLDKKSFGFSFKVALICGNCDDQIDELFLCDRVGGIKSTRQPFEVNTRAVLAFRGVGCGYNAMKDWCSLMNMPNSMSKDLYTTHHAKIHSASLKTVAKVAERSITVIRDAYHDTGVYEDEEGVMDIAVSFDGAWQRRGFSSHNGVASVIDLLTGLPIDFEVLSNFCLKCSSSEKIDDPVWMEKHSSNCLKNFEGSAKSMEVECARRIWNRSVQQFKLRYTTMLCDGDSSAYDAVVAEVPYGPMKKIEKEDCVNHISKRMGTALRNLIDVSKAKKESISGKGKLTQDKVKKIQNYYGRAIKDHADDVDLLKKRIFAILFHMSSSDTHPKHTHCPPGDKSWCFWKRAEAKGVHPGTHKDHEILSSEIGKKLVPIFHRLADSALLKRCSRNKTQNPNESLHQLIWKICPKSTYAGRKTIETAVAVSICQFSMGSTYRSALYQILGVEPGSYLERGSQEKDSSRLNKAKKASSEGFKRRRRALKFKVTQKDQKRQAKEGTMYAAGGFNSATEPSTD